MMAFGYGFCLRLVFFKGGIPGIPDYLLFWGGHGWSRFGHGSRLLL